MSCLGQCLQSLSPTWFLSASFLFCVFSSLVLPPWLFCPFLLCADWAMVFLPKDFFIWTVYRVNMLSWFMRPLVAGASGEQARRESPVALNGLLGPGQYRSGEWLARMQVYCRHSTSFSPSSCDTYPFMLFLPSPWADQKCAIYCEPLSQDPGGRRDHGVNVKMPPHSQASFVGKGGVRVQLDSVLS